MIAHRQRWAKDSSRLTHGRCSAVNVPPLVLRAPPIRCQTKYCPVCSSRSRTTLAIYSETAHRQRTPFNAGSCHYNLTRRRGHVQRSWRNWSTKRPGDWRQPTPAAWKRRRLRWLTGPRHHRRPVPTACSNPSTATSLPSGTCSAFPATCWPTASGCNPRCVALLESTSPRWRSTNVSSSSCRSLQPPHRLLDALYSCN